MLGLRCWLSFRSAGFSLDFDSFIFDQGEMHYSKSHSARLSDPSSIPFSFLIHLRSHGATAAPLVLSDSPQSAAMQHLTESSTPSGMPRTYFHLGLHLMGQAYRRSVDYCYRDRFLHRHFESAGASVPRRCSWRGTSLILPNLVIYCGLRLSWRSACYCCRVFFGLETSGKQSIDVAFGRCYLGSPDLLGHLEAASWYPCQKWTKTSDYPTRDRRRFGITLGKH